MHPKLGNFVRRHAEAVSQLHKVCVVAAVEAGFDEVEIKEEGNLQEIIIYFRKKWPIISQRNAFLRGIDKARLYFPEPDLIHLNVAFPAGLAALSREKPLVITEHFSGYHPISQYRWGFLHKLLTRRILKKAEVVMPVSNFLKEAIADFTSVKRFEVIPNVVNENLFYPAPYTYPEFTFLHISTLQERSKNIRGLLKGVKILQERGLNFRLKIGGDGDIGELQQKIDAAGISIERVEIITEKPLEGIASLMRECHSLLMFSHFETQSCTILEALCSGKPVVSSAVGGIPEIVGESNGILVEANNPQALADGMEKMIRNYQDFKPAAIAREARSKYSYAAVAGKISEVYTSVLKTAGSGR